MVGLFWLNGAAWSSIVPRYPEIKDALGLSNAWWGLVVGLGPIGGLIAGLLTARLMRRFSSANVAVVAQVAGICLLLLLGTAPWAWLFAAGLFAMAAMDSLTDIAMNSHGLRVQKAYGRSILNTFHGWWSIGAVSGGLIGAACAQARVPLLVQCLGAVVLFGAMSIGTRTLLLPGPDATPEQHAGAGVRGLGSVPRGIWLRVLALGVLGASIGGIEDVGASWGAVYMVEVYAAVPFVAGLAFVALQGAQTIGRLTGDRVVDRLGAQRTVTLGAALAGVGMLAAVLVGNQWFMLVGFACAGLGIAVSIPMAMHAADELPGLAPGVGLTVVTWLMRVGFFVSPPLIGALGEVMPLRWALLVVPVAAAAVVVLAPALRPVRRAP